MSDVSNISLFSFLNFIFLMILRHIIFRFQKFSQKFAYSFAKLYLCIFKFKTNAYEIQNKERNQAQVINLR